MFSLNYLAKTASTKNSHKVEVLNMWKILICFPLSSHNIGIFFLQRFFLEYKEKR